MVVNAWRAKINQNLEVSCPFSEEEMKKSKLDCFENVTKCKELGIRLLTSSTGFNLGQVEMGLGRILLSTNACLETSLMVAWSIFVLFDIYWKDFFNGQSKLKGTIFF